MVDKKINTKIKKNKKNKSTFTLCLAPATEMLESITNNLPNQINSFINDVNSQTKYIVSKLVAKRAIGIGFLINEEERVRGKKFNVF